MAIDRAAAIGRALLATCAAAAIACGAAQAPGETPAGDAGFASPDGAEAEAPAPALDPSFGAAGTFTGELSAWTPVAVASDALDRVLVSGPATPAGAPPDDVLLRLGTDDMLDDGFGTAGRVTLTLSPEVVPQLLQSLPDGRIGVMGAASVDGGDGTFAARFESDGSIDPSFGATPQLFAQSGRFSAGFWQPDGGGGFVFGQAAVLRFDSAGVLDPTFGAPGDVGPATAGAVASDGRVWTAAGASVSRYGPNGAVDTGFGQNGVVDVPPAGGSDPITLMALLLDDDGSADAVGSHIAGGFDFVDVVRLTPAGALDVTYGVGGVASAQVSTGPVGASRMTTGRLLVWTSAGDLVEAAADGSTTSVLHLSLPGGTVLAAALDPAGRLIVAGVMTGDPLHATYFVSRYVLP